MNGFFSMGTVLRLFSDGRFFRSLSAWVLRLCAVLIGIFALVDWIELWADIGDLDGTEIIGLLLFQVLFLIAVYVVVHAMFIRANNIVNLPDSDYIVIPIVSIFIRLFGEIYAAATLIMSFAVGILIWLETLITGISPMAVPFLPGGGGGANNFLAGLKIMFIGVLTAFFILVAFYLASELLKVLSNIATDLKAVRANNEQGTTDRSPTV